MKRCILFFMMLISLSVSSCFKGSKKHTYTGILEGKTLYVPALIGGKIEKLFVEVGDEVNIGDTIAIIDTSDLAFQRRQLEASLKEILVQQEIAKLNLKQSKSDLDFIREKFDRLNALFEEQAIPRQKLDDLQNQLKRVEMSHKTSIEKLHQLDAAEDRLNAQLESVLKKFNDAFIISPIKGVVNTCYYEEGEAVPTLQSIVEVIHLDELKVKIYLQEETLPKVKVGGKALVHIDGINRIFKGEIVWISSEAEFTPKTILTLETRTSLVYAAKVRVHNPEGILKHGMPVEVELKEM